MPGYPEMMKRLTLLCLMVFALVITPVKGDVRLEMAPDSLGYEGMLYPGLWTPVRVKVENTSVQPVSVRLMLPLSDADGDTAVYSRVVTVDGNRELETWLYGMAPASPGRVTVRAEDAETGVPLGQLVVQSALGGSFEVKRVLALGAGRTGLRAFEESLTRHEPLKVLQGFTLEQLPDRSLGLDPIDLICWSPGGGDPSGASWTPAQREALRDWVYRGGSLVVILPSAGEVWSSGSLRDLLPIEPGGVRRVEARPPSWLGRRQSEGAYKAMMQELVPREGAWVLGRLDDGSPLLVKGVYGFGTVTVLGADVTDPSFRRLVADDSRFRLWHRVFGWKDPVLPRAQVEQAIDDGKITRAESPVRIPISLSEDLSAPVDLNRSVGIWLNVLLLLTVGYWVLAGPVSYFVLKRQVRSEHSWLAFSVMIVVFGAVMWSVASFTGSGTAQVRHLSFLDIDARAGVGRMDSWMSAYTPEFNEVSIRFDQERPTARLSSPGWPGQMGVSFVDARAYEVDATAPAELMVPSRSASRMIRGSLVGPLHEFGWAETVRSSLTIEGGLPVGRVSFEGPAMLTYVQATYLEPGEVDPGRALTWRATTRWEPGEDLEIAVPDHALRLSRLAARYGFDGERSLKNEGYLGAQLISFPMRSGFMQGVAGSSRSHLMAKIPVTTFYDLMPPPRFHVLGELTDRAKVIRRGALRGLDLTGRLQPGCLILTGLMEGAPLAGRLLVNGLEPESRGPTVVRIVIDLGSEERGKELDG